MKLINIYQIHLVLNEHKQVPDIFEITLLKNPNLKLI